MTAVITQDDSNAWLSRLGTIATGSRSATVDGDVLEAVTNALYALATGEAAYAKRTIYKADAIDQEGTYSRLPAAVERAVADIETAGSVQAGTWDRIASIVEDSPLASLVERIRTA